MVNRHLYLGLGLLLLVGIAGGPIAAEEADTHQSKRCGGYYACIEHKPQQLSWKEEPFLMGSFRWRSPSRTDF
jgi:hypothetical protein